MQLALSSVARPLKLPLMNRHREQATPERKAFPPGAVSAWRFAACNGLSFQIVLGGTMILYAKSLGASATVLGLIAGMMPLMVIFQIPAAAYLNRISYKRFLLGGWGTRQLFTCGMAIIPMATGYLDATTQLVLLLSFLLGFNFLRGVSTCAWLPLITHLIPEKLLGLYLSGEATMSNLGSFVTVILCALCLGKQPHPWQFAIAFGFSALTGLASLFFLNRIPDVPITPDVRRSNEPVPWLEMLRHPSFRGFLLFVVVWSLAYGGVTAFSLAFLKAKSGLPDGTILLVTALAFLGGLGSMWIGSRRLDRFGCKPIIGLSLGAWLLILLIWLAFSGGELKIQLWLVAVVQLGMGLFAALIGVANNRLAMGIIPSMGRSHFLVLYSVFANLALGLAPVAWGLLIDLIGQHEFQMAGLAWNQFSIFFALVIILFLVTFWLMRWLHEPQASGINELLHDMLIQSPQRLWISVWVRH